MKANRRTKIYLNIVSLLSIALVITSLKYYPLVFNIDYLGFVIFTVITESFILLMANNVAVTLSFGLILPIAVLFNPSAAIMSAILCNVFSIYKFKNNYKHIFNIELFKTIGNVTNYIISTFFASYLFIYLNNGLEFKELYLLMIYIFVSILTFMTINTLLAATLIHLFTDYDFKDLIINNLSGFIPNILGVSTVSILIVLAYNKFGVEAIILMIFPYLMIRHSFKLVNDMRETYLSTIKALTAALEEKDPYTKGHSQRVEKYSLCLARAVRIKSLNIQQLQYAAIFHDVGKIGIPDYILNKPGKLTPEEFKHIQEHPTKGVKILKDIHFLSNAVEIIGAHHEYCDGSGYPKGLTDGQIPLEAKIITIADIFDAVTTDRPYRKAMTEQEAIDIIKEQSGTRLDPKLVGVFIELYNEGRLV